MDLTEGLHTGLGEKFLYIYPIIYQRHLSDHNHQTTSETIRLKTEVLVENSTCFK